MNCCARNLASPFATVASQGYNRNLMLKEGDKAPDIKLQTDTGEPFQLSKPKGKRIVLYFFPRADTPG